MLDAPLQELRKHVKRCHCDTQLAIASTKRTHIQVEQGYDFRAVAGTRPPLNDAKFPACITFITGGHGRGTAITGQDMPNRKHAFGVEDRILR